MNVRIIKDKMMHAGVVFVTLCTLVPLFAIIYSVVAKGIGQINWDFFTKVTPNSMEAMLAVAEGKVIPGGVLQGIVGTLLIVLPATFAAVPFGIGGGIYLYEKDNSRLAAVLRMIVDMIQGLPSIILGIIVYLWVVVPMKSYSAIAGSVAMFIMMLPMIVRSTEETLRMLPNNLREAGLTLGGTNFRVMMRVMLPSAFGGTATGILLAVSRVIGETAPLTLTILGSANVCYDPREPNSAVSLLIWEFYNDPNMQSLIWSAALLLLVIVLLLNLLAKKLSKG
ncbi:MAG: phosphate ABC transporter permease PstA [Candidatus Kapabacteria bacterium]|nr:phosphate ABC transporter permease PstA [Candidatus Kapabacteria bacterium]